MDGDTATYGSAEVARAAGIKRGMFDSWLLRKYLPLPPGPGTGRARQYTLLDAVRVAAMAHLTSIGVVPGRAGSSVAAIGRVPQPGDTLILTADPASGHSLAGVVYPRADVPIENNILSFVSRIVIHDSAGAPVRPPGHYRLDLFELAAQVQRGLQDPDWRSDLAAIEAAEFDKHVVLPMMTPAKASPDTAPTEQKAQPTPKRRARKAAAK